jgi:hypothetical protein
LLKLKRHGGHCFDAGGVACFLFKRLCSFFALFSDAFSLRRASFILVSTFIDELRGEGY